MKSQFDVASSFLMKSSFLKIRFLIKSEIHSILNIVFDTICGWYHIITLLLSQIYVCADTYRLFTATF